MISRFSGGLTRILRRSTSRYVKEYIQCHVSLEVSAIHASFLIKLVHINYLPIKSCFSSKRQTIVCKGMGVLCFSFGILREFARFSRLTGGLTHIPRRSASRCVKEYVQCHVSLEVSAIHASFLIKLVHINYLPIKSCFSSKRQTIVCKGMGVLCFSFGILREFARFSRLTGGLTHIPRRSASRCVKEYVQCHVSLEVSAIHASFLIKLVHNVISTPE